MIAEEISALGRILAPELAERLVGHPRAHRRVVVAVVDQGHAQAAGDQLSRGHGPGGPGTDNEHIINGHCGKRGRPGARAWRARRA